jgi:predicted DNA-binding protein (UPF0251 family)
VTNDQFLCCTTNASGASAEAARLVMVDGLSIAEASERIGIKPQSVSNALTRIRRVDSKIREAYCQQTTGHP